MKVPVAAAVFAALALSACQDPAGVGLGLIDEEQLDPSVRVVPLEDLSLIDDSTVAIGIAASSNTALGQPRVLVGEVRDPAFGDARAVAYVDAIRGSGADGVSAGDITAIWLELHRSGYVYGDTTTALPLELREIEGDWEADVDYAPDTTFAVGGVLATASVAQADTLVRFDLPAAWVQGNAPTFASADFGTAFEGLAVRPGEGFAPAPGVVYGFDTFESAGSGFRVVADGDTLLYPLSEVFSSVAVEAPTMPPAAVAPVRAQSQASLGFGADVASVGPTALARARLRLPLEAGLAQSGPFVRPIASRAFLYGLRGEGDDRVRSLLAVVVFDDEGEATVTDTATLSTAFQAVLLAEADPFDRFELVPDPAVASLDVLPVRVEAPTATPPRFTLTLVGTGL